MCQVHGGRVEPNQVEIVTSFLSAQVFYFTYYLHVLDTKHDFKDIICTFSPFPIYDVWICACECAGTF